MKTLVIEQKMSNTGSIYDLASDCWDITLRFNRGRKYAVVAPAYYNLTAAFAKSEENAIKKYNKLVKMGYEGVSILDEDGATWTVYSPDQLVRA